MNIEKGKISMNKKGAITLGLMAMLAGSVGAAGCSRTRYQTCVDSRGVIVSDRYCGGSAYIGGALAYRWYYSGRYQTVGQKADPKGSFTKPTTGTVQKASLGKRGVFGRSGRGGGSASGRSASS